MAALPVTISPSFFQDHQSDGLHALQWQPQAKSSIAGSTLRVNNGKDSHPKTGSSVQLDLADGHGSLKGNMHDAPETDCVLLWNESTNTYTLHRLSTITRLSGLSASRQKNGVTTPTSAAFPPSPSSQSVARTVPPSSPSPAPRPAPAPAPAYGLGISAPPSSRSDQVLHHHPSTTRNSNSSFHSSVNAIEVEEFDADLASSSESENGDVPGIQQLPPAATVATGPFQSNQPNHSQQYSAATTDDDDDDDENDFDDLANDLEESLGNSLGPFAGPASLQSSPAAIQRQVSPTPAPPTSRPVVAGKKIPNHKPYKSYDSDIASSSESEDDSD